MGNINQFIIITSIFEPTTAVKKFAELNNYHLVVVGDKKSPNSWQCDQVTYLSVENQIQLPYPLVNQLPFNHYCRKMIGYLYAIEQGAEVIIDTDDDNIPYDNWSFPAFNLSCETINEPKGFYNIYSEFTKQKIWPRGLPLSKINAHESAKNNKITDAKIGIWQGLADGDPDVDAIYRLVDNTPCLFDKRNPIALSEGVICPFNSQNTAFAKAFFPLLYLPAFVTFRFTDILRGFVAQPILWKSGYLLGFTEATVFQERNAHNYMRDFESEIPMYLHTETCIELITNAISDKNSISDNLFLAYQALETKDIVTKQELELLHAWLKSF